jgi:hypothetical protein
MFTEIDSRRKTISEFYVFYSGWETKRRFYSILTSKNIFEFIRLEKDKTTKNNGTEQAETPRPVPEL